MSTEALDVQRRAASYAYVVLDEQDRIVHVSTALHSELGHWAGHVLWDHLPGARDVYGPCFAEARTSAVGGSGHACEFETSLLSHLAPGMVGDPQGIRRPIEARTPRDFRDLTDAGQTAIGYTFAERFPEGIMGDPTVATAETGERIWEAAVQGIVEFLADFRTLPPEGVTAKR